MLGCFQASIDGLHSCMTFVKLMVQPLKRTFADPHESSTVQYTATLQHRKPTPSRRILLHSHYRERYDCTKVP